MHGGTADGTAGLGRALRGKGVRTTIPAPGDPRPADLVDRDFTATAPNQLWVADFTYVATWSGTVYVAFVFDVFSRRIVGLAGRHHNDHRTGARLPRARDLVTPPRRRSSDLTGLVHHTDAGSQYTSFAFTQRLIDEGVDASVGSVGDAYDNALAESQIGLYKTELIRPEGPWRDVDHVELGTLEWVDWFNTERPHESIDDLTPIQAEEVHYAAPDYLPDAPSSSHSGQARSTAKSTRSVGSTACSASAEPDSNNCQSTQTALPRGARCDSLGTLVVQSRGEEWRHTSCPPA